MPDSLAGEGGSGFCRPISFQRKADVSMVSLPFARLVHNGGKVLMLVWPS